jgi:hypothetical protein
LEEIMLRIYRYLAAACTAATLAAPAAAQSAAAWYTGVTSPPQGGAQRASVTQGIGLVRVTIDYSSPHVHSPSGVDRRGKIWGQGGLVGYGMTSFPIGTCGDECPWRGGANENTVFTTTHGLTVQGQRLPAGSYGLHFIPQPGAWTIIFSKVANAWGSFTYDPKEDALRVAAKPQPSAYHEDLTYEFRDRQPDGATAVLRWEDLELPFALQVADVNDLYVARMREDLRSTGGFDWRGWTTAAQFCLANQTHLDEALLWAQRSLQPAFFGEENFTTLSTLAEAELANGKLQEGKATLAKALGLPTAGVLDIHLVGRQLIAMKRPADAVEVFETNVKLHPNDWPVRFGLARGYAALGQRDKAIAQAKLALPQAPDAVNRLVVNDFIDSLESGKSGN